MNIKLLTFCCVGVLLVLTRANPQVTGYVDNVSDFQSSGFGDGAVTIGGYHNKADGGGGVVTAGPSAGCSPANNGTTFKDSSGTCYYRVNPTNDVREWGAYCDVVALSNQATPNPPWGPILWNGADNDGTNTGAIEIPAVYFNPSSSTSFALPTVGTPGAPTFITATQIGPVIPYGTSNPPVWANRWSTLATTGTGYTVGDMLTFTNAAGGTTGTFSQQIAIAVDQVADSMGNILPPSQTGQIYKWHFVWGGQYTSLPVPATGLAVDTSHSYTTGSGATFNPSWSGWSVTDKGTVIDTHVAQTGYTVGSTVTFAVSGGTLNGTQNPEIVVMAVSGPPDHV